jgi:hypothetical protein
MIHFWQKRSESLIFWSAMLHVSTSALAQNRAVPSAEIKPLRTSVVGGQSLPVETRIRNNTASDLHIEYWSCSISEQWRSDNSQVKIDIAACDKNVPMHLSLKPGASFGRRIAVTVAARQRSPTLARFRLGFDRLLEPSELSPAIFWSNAVTVRVQGVTK